MRRRERRLCSEELTGFDFKRLIFLFWLYQRMRKMLAEKETLGKILTVVGALLLLIGVLFIGGTSTHQLIRAIGWFFGAVLLVAGLALTFELFTYSTMREKLGVFLMLVSAVLMITALIVYSFTEFGFIYTGIDAFLRGGVRAPNLIIIESHPYVWVIVPLAGAALFLFVAGLLLTLFDNFF